MYSMLIGDCTGLRSLLKSEIDILLTENGSLMLLVAGGGGMTILSLYLDHQQCTPSLITSTG